MKLASFVASVLLVSPGVQASTSRPPSATRTLGTAR